MGETRGRQAGAWEWARDGDAGIGRVAAPTQCSRELRLPALLNSGRLFCFEAPCTPRGLPALALSAMNCPAGAPLFSSSSVTSPQLAALRRRTPLPKHHRVAAPRPGAPEQRHASGTGVLNVPKYWWEPPKMPPAPSHRDSLRPGWAAGPSRPPRCAPWQSGRTARARGQRAAGGTAPGAARPAGGRPGARGSSGMTWRG